MITTEKLREFGADTDTGLKRCMNNEGFYIRLVVKALEDRRVYELGKLTEAGDFEAAFEVAHALKGMFSNLALDPIAVPVSEITELLREKKETDYRLLVAEIESRFEDLKRLAET